MVRHQHDQYQLPMPHLWSGVSHSQYPWQPESVILIWWCFTMLCKCITGRCMIPFFFRRWTLYCKIHLIFGIFFESFTLKLFHMRIFCRFFSGSESKEKITTPSPAVCSSINNGGTSGNCNINWRDSNYRLCHLVYSNESIFWLQNVALWSD